MRFDESELHFSPVLSQLVAKTNGEAGGAWLPAWLHATDTAGVIRLLVLKWLPPSAAAVMGAGLAENGLQKLCTFLALVHDIGKLTPVFQARVLAALPAVRARLANAGLTVSPFYHFRNAARAQHARAGETILYKNACPSALQAIVGAHHGRPQDVDVEDAIGARMAVDPILYYDAKEKNTYRIWEQVRQEWLAFALAQAGYASMQDLPQPDMAAQVLLTGLLIMADWIASNTQFFPLIEEAQERDSVFACERAARAWQKLKLPDPWAPNCFGMDATLFQTEFGFAPNAVQQAVLDAVQTADAPGIFILEAQMGVGKTEAALAAAQLLASTKGCSGVFFGLPTQATANGIFKRLERWAQGQSQETCHAIRLAHAMAELNDDYTALFSGVAYSEAEDKVQANGLVVHPWFAGRKQALLSDFVVSTVDQLLMAGLKQKHVMLRHLGLAGKVVIIDECHAYDAYMNRYLDRVLTWLGAYQVPVIILSATLPAARRAALIRAYGPQPPQTEPEGWRTSRAYPLLTWTDGGHVRQAEIAVHTPARKILIERLADDAVAGCLAQALASGGCAAVIVNTVQRAQAQAEILRRCLPEEIEVVVFHAQFLMPDRAQKETLLLKRLGKSSAPNQRNNLVVVGTQVLEQSLDLDFDFMITDLCPMDLLLQRIGRLHRHNRQRPAGLTQARCVVLGAHTNERENGAKAIYGEWLLQCTQALLPPEIILPDSIPALVQDTYAPSGTLCEAARSAWNEYEKKQKKKSKSAGVYCVPKPDKRQAHKNAATITGWLATTLDDGEARAQAAVRDGDPAVSVLVMMRHADGSIHFLPWQYGGVSVPANHVPAEAECRQIARQQLRLPHVFCVGDNLDHTIAALEQHNAAYLAEWQQSQWLKGELVLLLDQNCQAGLIGYQLTYHRENGLVYKKEKSDGSDGT